MFAIPWKLISAPSPSSHQALNHGNFRYKLPDGYTIEKTPGAGGLDSVQAYAAKYTLQNKASAVVCKVILASASPEWQQLVGASSRGLSPRASSFNPLPAQIESRHARLSNSSAPLEQLTSFYASDWYGPESNATDFFMAFATIIVQASDTSDKDVVINFQSVEESGYHLNVTNTPLQSQVDNLSNRCVLNLCAYAYGEVTKRMDYGIDPITNLYMTSLWTNGTVLIQQHV
ncbi:MAG: hypothetical protein Q9218_004039 [Villophora microphyllina]